MEHHKVIVMYSPDGDSFIQTYTFKTQEEADAFKYGLEEACCCDCKVINELAYLYIHGGNQHGYLRR